MTGLLVLFLVSYALTADNCRACSGFQKIYFFDRLTSDQATAFFKSNFGGKDFTITKTAPEDCEVACLDTDERSCIEDKDIHQVCQTFTFSIDVNRYCGDGGDSVHEIQHDVNALGYTASRQILRLGCKSVKSF